MHPLAEPLRDILPLLVGSALALAFVPLVATQWGPERIPSVARKVNGWGIAIAPVIVFAAAFLALWYVGSSTAETLMWVSYGLLILAFIILVTAFLVPVIINTIPALWIRTYYTQFEEVQFKDLEEARKAIEKLRGAGKRKKE